MKTFYHNIISTEVPCFDLNSQFQHEMEKAGEKTAASSSQKFEIDKLKEAMEQQKAEIGRLRWLLDNVGTGNFSSLSVSCG